MRFWYPASITQITSINDSFDSCILRICYAGRNRNQTFISKEAIERAIPTMSYCPLVANYDVETDEIGGHDVAFVENDKGELKMVNLTDAIGVIPENPQWCWESVVEDDGTEREYLSTPAILWKRTPVYAKLKAEGVSGQSMEINVREGRIVDGLYEIDAFEFTAFCLLGENVEPCFESAQVAMYSTNSLNKRLGEMMDDFKKNFTKVMTATADDNISTPIGEKTSLEGGECSLNMDELLQKYGLTVDEIDFETEGMTNEEIEAKFAELKAKKFEADGDDASEDESSGETDGESGDETAGETESGPDTDQTNESGNDGATADDGDDDVAQKKQYSLTGIQLRDGILDALRVVSYVDEWGEWPRYCFTDYDPAVNEVYAYDNEDWNLYGFTYSMNGDNVIVDFASKRRKKIAFVDFDNGDMQFSYKHMFDSATARFEAVASEVKTLREFKKTAEDSKREAEITEMFNKFADLTDDDAFKALVENHSGMTVQDIEDKCFAIRGRKVQVKFSQVNAPVRMPVEGSAKHADADEPYGGIFVEFGIGNR